MLTSRRVDALLLLGYSLHWIKLDFTQAVSKSVLKYRCSTWLLMKRIEEKQHKATCCFINILEATPNKTVVVQALPPILQTIHLIRTGGALLEKWRRTKKRRSLMDSDRWTHQVDQQRSRYISRVLTFDVVVKTYQEQYMMTTDGASETGTSWYQLDLMIMVIRFHILKNATYD